MISFGFFVDWQLGIAMLWLLYRAALAGRIPMVAERVYLLSVVPLAAAVAVVKIVRLHAVVAAPALAVESMGQGAATPLPVVVPIEGGDWVLFYNIVVGLVAMVWIVGAIGWWVRWRKGQAEQGVRWCAPMRGGVASSLFSCIAIEASMRDSDACVPLLAHERAHVRCGHSWDMLYLCVVRSVLWINPIVWLLGRDLVRVHEAQADRMAVAVAVSPRYYINMLLGAQIGSAGAAVPERLTPIHYFSYVSVKNRIQMMTRTFPSRRSLWRLLAVLPVGGAMLMMFSFTPTEVVLDPQLTVSESPKAAALNEPVFKADVMPKFQGKDLDAFRTWVQGNLTYPKSAVDQQIQGRVLVTFVIEKDGSVSEVKVLRGVNAQLDEAAVKVIQSSPKWSPGLVKNEPVRIRYNMPVDFMLDKTPKATSEGVQIKKFGTADPKPEEPVFKADVMPTFEGKDIGAFRSWVQSKVVYPTMAVENGIQGRVNMTFVVEKDGSVGNVQVLRGVAGAIDSAALAVVKSSPRWSPGLVKNEPVRVRYNMPVDFVLQ